MNIQINRDFEQYTDDFFKGLSLRQTVYAAATVGVGAFMYLMPFYRWNLPSIVCIYMAIPCCLPVGLIGFFKINNMTFLEWLKARNRVTGGKPLLYISEEAHYTKPEAAKKGKRAKEQKEGGRRLWL